ncbi:protein phosphatase 1D-like [Antedon mediterranea]|uniref:protein phosphatase 1D-like n=1 Tax=Antedon mediterranea TaxID=105859 RepID=UPI003AF4ED8A
MTEEDNLLTGLRFRVSNASDQGGRNYMEDVVCEHFEKTEAADIACFAVFDGHGGREAAVYARDHLWKNIKNQPGFLSFDEKQTKKAIKDGFAITQNDMWKFRAGWKKTSSGYASTAGTTCSMAIIIGIKMYIAHVGDSGIVMGFDDEGMINYKVLTTEHKPDSRTERKRIEQDGGLVMPKNGVNRVVWKRPKIWHQGPVRRSTNIDCIPFLAVARSLGDLWSYNFESKKYIISPEPDIDVLTLDPYEHKFFIIGSDGLWNMMRPGPSVDIIADYERNRILKKGEYTYTASYVIVKYAIKQWNVRCLRADNTTSIVVFIDPMDTVEKPSTEAGRFYRGTGAPWTSLYSDIEKVGYIYHRPSVEKVMNQSLVNGNDDTPTKPSLKRSYAFRSDPPLELSPKRSKMTYLGLICTTCCGYKLMEEDKMEVEKKLSKKKMKRQPAGTVVNGVIKMVVPMCVTKVIIPKNYRSPAGYRYPNRRCYGEKAYAKKKAKRREEEEKNAISFWPKIIIPTKYKTPGSNGKPVKRRCFSEEPVVTTKILSITTPKDELNLSLNSSDVDQTKETRVPLAVKRLKTEPNNLPETPKNSRKACGKVSPTSYSLRRRSDTDLICRKMVTRARSKVVPRVKETRSKTKVSANKIKKTRVSTS